MSDLLKDIKHDLPASIVVFFVAVPLCLGIALASGAPLMAGIIAGIIGGIVVGAASGSPLGVSGPAAGLAVIVLGGIATLGSWEAYLVAIVLAGVIQVVMGFLGLGALAYYFPSSVIKGMLAGIGLLIVIKQIPHALGMIGTVAEESPTTGGDSAVGPLTHLMDRATPGAVLACAVALVLMLSWDAWLAPRSKALRAIPGPLVAVASGMGLNALFESGVLPWGLGDHQMVSIPVASTVGEFFGQLRHPDFSILARKEIYLAALVIAVIASIETLLCVEATDRLDPQKRITPTNRELKAQGLGNILSGLLGGLPVTQVIVRSSANLAFGARSKLSAILHGVLILVSVALFPTVLNMIPLATLAAVLLVVGYKLAKPALFMQMYRLGWEQWAPFVATVGGILATDLLRGIGIGVLVSVVIILRHDLRNPFTLSEHAPSTPEYQIALAEQVSFLNKGRILAQLQAIPENSHVVIDGSQSKVVDWDVVEIIRDFRLNAATRKIVVELRGSILENNNTELSEAK